VLHLVDFRHGLLKNDRELQEWIRGEGKNVFVVFTKGDKISRGKWRSTRDGYIRDGLYSHDVPVVTSAESKEGVGKLGEFLVKFLKDCATMAEISAERM
ncbi:MAG: ribosome biogenesis GTP-binding protein YsxC, partial [Synergistaceae bacterium]|nr:ribosome biogenesis GTP-binding protein YsxC [Synergistaceae bacterium]